MIPEIHAVGQQAVLYAQARSEQILDWIQEEIGKYEYQTENYMQEVRFISAAGEITCVGHPVASVAVEPETLLWRWNEGEQSAVAAMRTFGQQHGLASFTTQEVPYQPVQDAIAIVANDVCYAAFEIFGAETMYIHVPMSAAGSRMIALLSNFSRPVPPMTLAVFFSKFPRLISSYVDNAEVSMAGLDRMRSDWQVAQIAPKAEFSRAWRITDENGEFMDAHLAYDELGRITNVQVSGVHRPQT